MDQMADALERAGFPPGLLAFASAAYDLARLALNQSPDPRQAAHAWLGMASGRAFREGPLTDFMELVARQQEAAASAAEKDQNTAATHSPRVPPAAEPRSALEAGARGHAAPNQRPPTAAASSAGPAPAGGTGQTSTATQRGHAPSPAGTASGGAGGHERNDAHMVVASPPPGTPSAGAEGHGEDDTQRRSAPAPAGPPSAGGAGHYGNDAQKVVAPPPAGTEHEGGGHGDRDTHTPIAPAPVYREPTPGQRAALREAKQLSARVMSGVYVTDRFGEKRMVDELQISGLGYRLSDKGRWVAQGAVEYNTLYLIKRECDREREKQGEALRGFTVGDLMDAHRIRHLHDMARAFAASPMIQMPEALRAMTKGPHAP